MTQRRARFAAIATVLGLGALGGVALESNPGTVPTTAQVAGTGHGAVVTSASGSTAVSQPAVAGNGSEARAPIVTRASGTGAGGLTPVDD